MKNAIQFFILLAISLNLFLLVSLVYQPFQTIDGYSDNIDQNENVLGIVNNGSFIIVETNDSKKLTSISMQEGAPPESGLIDLIQYEGKAILVSTYPQVGEGEWLWRANITDIGSPITSKIVKKIHGFE
jgi:hypothetical protein